MKFVWDEVKRQANLRKRGLDFADLEDGFEWDDMLVAPTYPGRDGRVRFIAVAMMGTTLTSVIFAPLGTEAIAVVTMRRASRKERRQYVER